ncbi:MAG: TetR/AcrR family transcriptional regulator [Neisseriaceae bacterium]|nr:TetR/AcrR family transcriptional regulator [Neisseriaceae bacterium]
MTKQADRDQLCGRPRQFVADEVIDAALDVFWRQGYEATSAQDLCDSTGLGRGSLYNAFGSKHGLYEQALRRYHTQAWARISAILAGDGDVKARLTALLHWAVAEELGRCADKPNCMALFAVMERGQVDPLVTTLNEAYTRRLATQLTQLMQMGQQSGELSTAVSAQQLAHTFMSNYYGLRLMGQTLADKAILADIVAGTVAHLAP